jgi:hypothetical protein
MRYILSRATPFLSKREFHRQPTLTAGVALSYFHSERSEESAFRENQREEQIFRAKSALEMTSWGVFQRPVKDRPVGQFVLSAVVRDTPLSLGVPVGRES